MRGMKKKNKVVLVKVYILLCWCWIIALLYAMCRVEWGINPEWENLAHIMLVVSLCLVVLMVYFVSKAFKCKTFDKNAECKLF